MNLTTASCYHMLFICSIPAKCAAHGAISISFAAPRYLVKQNKYANQKQLAYFPVFSVLACDKWARDSVCILKKNEKRWEITHTRREEIVCFGCYYPCFVYCCWFILSQQSEQDLSWERKSKSSHRARSLPLNKNKPRFIRVKDRFCINYRLQTAYKVVFWCVLLSQSVGTLFASAPSRPDVLAFKRTGSGLQLSFPHCI